MNNFEEIDSQLNFEYIKCLNCDGPIEVDNRLLLQKVTCLNCNSEFNVEAFPDGSRTEFYETG